MRNILRVALIGLFLNIGVAAGAAAFFDTYPKNPKIHVINYIFKMCELTTVENVDSDDLAVFYSEINIEV